MRLSSVYPFFQAVAVACCVFVAGRVGEMLAEEQSKVALVRPASGVALAALLLWGLRLWPGVAVGIFLVHLSLGDELTEVLLAPVGATLSALLGAMMLRRLQLSPALDRVSDVLILVGPGVLVSPLPAAAIGSFAVAGIQHRPEAFLSWWLGDAMGVLVLCPTILCWASPRPRAVSESRPEVLVWFLCLLVSGALVYGEEYFPELRHPQMPFIVFPLLLWAALRFDQRTTTAALLLVSAVAVAAAAVGVGPFARRNLDTALIYLLSFLALVSLTTLLFTAVILERSRAEERLRQSEQRFRLLAENSQIGFWQITPDGRTVFANPAICDMLEVPDASALAGETCHRFLSEESRARVREEHARRWRGEASTYEVELVGRRGGRRDVIVCGVPLMGPDGAPETLIATFTDITARKLSEEAVRTSQEMLRLVLDNIPLYVFWKDVNCVYLGCNNNAARIAGLESPEQIVGKTDFDLPSTDEEARQFQEWDRRVIHYDRGEYHLIEPLHLPDGSVGWLDTTKVPLHDAHGKVIGVLGLFEDITERKRMEEALRASERRFRALIENSWDGITVADAHGRLIYHSPSVARILGRAEGGEDPPGTDLLAQVHPDDLGWAVENLGWLRQQPGRIVQGEMRVRHASGEWVWLECVGRNLLDEPSVAGIVSNFRDITDRKRTQEELLRHQARERELVEAELARVRAELVRTTRLTALGQVAASIAHELRNPLGAIRNAVYLLRRRVPPGEVKWIEYLDILDREAMASDRIITNLLELSRPKEPVREPVDAAELLRETFGRLHPPESVSWNVNAEGLPRLRADRLQLRQVFDNLVKNAIEAVGERGTISVDAISDASYATIVIQDDGPGVAPEHRPLLFEPLFSTKVKGTGLGLYVSRQIVERHGGTLEYLDRPGGAAFRVRLPLDRGS